MANYKQLIPFILKWEGGFSNDPKDLGGATMKGVTLKTYTDYCRRKGLPKPTVEDLKKIPDSHWGDIFKSMYWDRWKADQILSQAVANLLVDWVWLSGSYSITTTQRFLGFKGSDVDGRVGPKTIKAINDAGPKLFDGLYKERIAYIERIVKARPANLKFRRGWLNRLRDLGNVK